MTEDPGWASAIRRALVPYGFLLAPKRFPGGLVALRTLYVSFVYAILLFAFVITYVIGSPRRPVDARAIVGIVAVGLVALVGVAWARRRELPTSSVAALAAGYRTRMFVMIAFGEAPALVGFPVALVVHSIWPYLAGAAFTLAAFRLAAPTAADIRRCQDAVRASGSSLSLRDALEMTPPRRPGRGA
jgi:hypothetical protein